MHTTTLILAALAANGAPEEEAQAHFAPPVRLQAAGEYIATEEPGYAAPCLHDVDGDGRKDLVVGQFAGGKMKVYPRRADGSFGAGEWLRAGGDVAEVPGVW